MPVALKSTKLLGTVYAPGDTVTGEVWARVPERNRRVLERSRTVGPDVPPPALSNARPAPASAGRAAKKGA